MKVIQSYKSFIRRNKYIWNGYISEGMAVEIHVELAVVLSAGQ